MNGFFRSDCRKFTGYRPCAPEREDCRDCGLYEPRGTRILIVNLDSMGDVLRSTAVLPALKRKYPESHISWVTLPRAAALLENNPCLDRVLAFDAALPFLVETLEFDLALNVDKGLPSGALMNRVTAGEKLGFGLDANGVIAPLNEEARELYDLGLNDRVKFFVNAKTENQLLAEAFRLEYRRDPCVFAFSPAEEEHREEVRERLGLSGQPLVVGVNTGCSNLYPYKKLPLNYQKALIFRLREKRPEWPVVLLGGMEDGERNAELAAALGGDVVSTPTNEGLRRGMVYADLADVVFTGDSLGMHMAIALGKRIVAWFGLTCDQEIELFDRGEKLLAGVDCRPCWKKSCDRPVKCFDQLDMDQALKAILRQGDLALGSRG